MINVNTLEQLLSEYGIDYKKVIDKNQYVIEYGVYKNIQDVLEYLVNELHIAPRNIQKSPSILYLNVSAIRQNYEFLKSQKISITKIEKSLHILSTDPTELKQTYNYILKNYGIEHMNKITSILSIKLDKIKEIEQLGDLTKEVILSIAIRRKPIEETKKIIETCKKYNIPITSSVFLNSSEEIEQIIKVCNDNNINITGSVFKKTANEIKKIIEVCKKNNIPITGSVFVKTSEEVEKLIQICQKYNIPIKGNVFKKTAEQTEQIINVCKQNNIPLMSSMFKKQAEEIEKTIKLCKENNIEITPSIFFKTTEELEKSIIFIKENYGDQYLKTLIVNKDKGHIEKVFKYLEELDVLPIVINSSSILMLTLQEIKQRTEYILNNNLEIVVNNRFNSIYGLSRKNFKEKTTNKKL